MNPKTLLLDLDNTLYPMQSGLIDHIDQRIDDYLMKRLTMERAAVNALRNDYYRRYGTTLRGVWENHGIDPLEYFDHAYQVDLERFLTPDPRLGEVLRAIPARKYVFSNSPRAYVERVLELLGIANLMEGIFDLTFSGYRGKPDPEAYRMVLESLGTEGRECVMVEDYPINLVPAKALSMTTVLIEDDPSGEKPDYVDLRLDSIYRITEIWA